MKPAPLLYYWLLKTAYAPYIYKIWIGFLDFFRFQMSCMRIRFLVWIPFVPVIAAEPQRRHRLVFITKMRNVFQKISGQGCTVDFWIRNDALKKLVIFFCRKNKKSVLAQKVVSMLYLFSAFFSKPLFHSLLSSGYYSHNTNSVCILYSFSRLAVILRNRIQGQCTV